ncbi:MAG: extracellular solute-binding protein [Solirubrobacteraceae bacterium]
MRRIAAVLATGLAALAISACGGSSSGATGGSGGAPAQYNGKPVTISFWNPFTGREEGVMDSIIADFHKLYPKITVQSRGAISDDNIVAAIRGGSPPDLTMSESADNLGEYCGTGAWINLGPYIKRDDININVMPAAVRQYTQFDGDRCALPDLADAYGLYYNKALFAKAGITSPPKTFAQLTQDAEKLTQFNPDGSIKIAGFVPTSSFYENAAAHYAPLWDAQWDENGKSSLSTDPAWASYLRWEKQLIDFYGANKLARFLSGAGEEFSTNNDFETGKIAMEIDGEWRVQFIKSDHAKIVYATAPAPVDPSQPQLYGGGYTTGNVMGIPKGAAHPAAAWLLAKYLAFNTGAIEKFAHGLGNVPTITSALTDPALVHEPHFDTFLKIFGNPHTQSDPITAIGSANQTMFQSFQSKWEDGSIPDSGLQSALKGVDSQIDAQVANQTAGEKAP